MKKVFSFALLLLALSANAQVSSVASFLQAQPKTDNVVPFRLSDDGVSLPIEWGLDVAWYSEANLRKGVTFAGKELIDIVRVSFQPTHSVEDGQWHGGQLDSLQARAYWVKKWCKSDVTVNINDDHVSVDKWYNYSQSTNTQAASMVRAERWAKLIRMAYDFYTGQGLKVASISPFNESDYGWNQGCSAGSNNAGRKRDFLNICNILREQEDLKGVRMCGGNTLNCNRAYDWWYDLRTGIDEGNTHQLAGDFDKYAEFFTKVRDYGHEATNDELHNTMEAMVGVEYGLNRGIWWGTCEYTRSQFMKASNYGKRLAYGENRPKWTAASVYRNGNKLQAFGGTSERQANTTTYRIVSEEQDVYFNGYGPTREYVMTLPGGTGYQQGQTNAETVVNIQAGEDVQPITEGTFYIINANSGYALTASASAGSNITPKSFTSTTYNNISTWNITPVPTTYDDLSGYLISLNVTSSNPYYINDKNWSLEEGNDMIMWQGGGAGCEQWHLEYCGDGLFYIISRQSGLCLMPRGGSSSGVLVQGAIKESAKYQKWRLMPAGTLAAKKGFSATSTNVSDLAATPQSSSISLSWTRQGSTTRNLQLYYATYQILRREKGQTDDDWKLIAKDINGTSFIDNTALPGITYEYAIRTYTACGVRSARSAAIEATIAGDHTMLASLCTGDSITDASENANHAAIYGTATYVDGPAEGCRALKLDGTNYLQLPPTLPQHQEITIAAWVKWSTSSAWQRIFDFGSGEQSYMFLTPRADSGRMRFAVKNVGSSEEKLDATKALATNVWTHVAITMGTDGVKIYLNGVENASSTSITVRPTDINTIFNYVGRSQFNSDPMFKGNISGFSVFNYALSPLEIKALCDDPTAVETVATDADSSVEDTESAYDLSGRQKKATDKGVTIQGGKIILNK